MQKISSIVFYIIVAISVALALAFFLGGNVTEGTGLVTDDEPRFTAIGLYWSYLLFGIAILLTITFAFFHIITHPKAIKGALIVLVLGGALVAISYALSADISSDIQKMPNESPAILKWTGTGLWATYILGGIALLGIVVSEIYRAFN
ncbi:MAG: hypothetical protein IPM71_09970 [Bacteroidota bacterium]|nr:MAG: hypothetical protein IPM71_09970 [Bacteroidota bacterium]